MAAQPWNQFLEAKLVGPIEVFNKHIGLLSIRPQPGAIDGKKSIGGGERSALVSVDERMVLRETLPESRGFFDQIGVIACLGPVEGGFEKAIISDTLGTTVTFNLIGVNGEHFSQGQKVAHLASFL
jgi:hypothetical protein